jgi:chondroitin 4-sulfotransferase 11
LKLVYLSVPKAACTAIKLALAKAIGIVFEPDQDIEYIVHFHPKWHREGGRLTQAQSGYYRFSFVRDPFDRLVSCYRSKIFFKQTAKTVTPLYASYYFSLPVNISFADFVQRVVRIPDSLADSHFKSQYAMLYHGEELQVDTVGRFEHLDEDWKPIAARYNLDPTLAQSNVSKNKPGCHNDYRLYYTEPLARLVYERYRKDVQVFGYEKDYEALLEFVRRREYDPVLEASALPPQMEKEPR